MSAYFTTTAGATMGRILVVSSDRSFVVGVRGVLGGRHQMRAALTPFDMPGVEEWVPDVVVCSEASLVMAEGAYEGVPLIVVTSDYGHDRGAAIMARGAFAYLEAGDTAVLRSAVANACCPSVRLPDAAIHQRQ